ncbi:MAG: hypothetical protein A2X86_13165 [Bdellovibrionales bacterium GWA2_49_15]|nr:MAG: hypothetical protein A2X86_13165 [Bdellovibrionales bacterium GWA2_49_15]HAZ13473.1 hypothetical protein [Bdellovibrionales bacterium]
MLVLLGLLFLLKDALGGSCTYKAPTYFTPVEKKFCLNFATDYYYRLRFINEEHRYRVGRKVQKYERETVSVDGALFLLGQMRAESGWDLTKTRANNNFWGLGGDYQRPDGTSSFMKFENFEQGLGFLMNHFARGITTQAHDTPKHPGWPNFLPLLKEEVLDTVAINKSLHAAKWCQQFPAYNTDQESHCKGRPNCPCVDYSGLIQKFSSTLVIARCLAVYEKHFNHNKNGLALQDLPMDILETLPVPEERLRIVWEEMKSFAMQRYSKKYCQ